jgi:hypothetical protein
METEDKGWFENLDPDWQDAIMALILPGAGLLTHGYHGPGTLVGLGLMWLFSFGLFASLREYGKKK